MTERRTDNSQPLVPHRTLSPSAPAAPATGGGDQRKPLSERVSAALSSTTAAKPGATSPSPAPAPSRAPRPSSAKPIGKPFADVARPAKVRKARLRLTHIDPWSVMKTAFLLSVAIGVVTVVAVAIVWGVLGIAGVWESINKTVVDVVGGDTAGTFDIRDYLGPSRVLGFTMIVAVVDVVLITALATLGAFLYNLSAALLGGLEVTLAEDEH